MARRRQSSGTEGDAVAALKQKAGPRSGLVRAVLYLKPEQLAALVGEARRRADERGVIRADTSAVAREAIGAWLKERQ